MASIRWMNVLILCWHAALVGTIAYKVNTTVPEPYMDEIFHINQAQVYCAGRWRQWDPKLTTPPGLYIPSALLSQFLSLPICSVAALRAVNAILVVLLPILVADLLATIRFGPKRPRYTTQQVFKEAITISSFPLVFFFAFLYYTDVASLFVLLLTYRQALNRRHRSSALLGLASLAFRQTNILWVGFIALDGLVAELRTKEIRSKSSQTEIPQDLASTPLTHFPMALFGTIKTVLTKYEASLPLVLPYAPVAAAFVTFLAWNQGIVLGDKTMHVPVLHIPQIYYFLAFASSLSLPLTLQPSNISASLLGLVQNLSRCILSIFTVLFMLWTIRKYTFEHPFLLADNRHYPFYVWRRVFNIHPLARYAIAPGYLLGASLLHTALAQANTWSVTSFVGYMVVTLLTLVPSPLIEFRYFIVPYIILRLHLRAKHSKQITAEYALNIVINTVTLYLFLYQPFKWVTEDGLQRFMW